MIKMIVDAECVLARDDGSFARFLKGEVDMLEADAAHWYTKLFAKPVEVEPVEVATQKAAKVK